MMIQTGKTLLLAAFGGCLFQLLHIPLAWLLGPMTILLVWREWLGRAAFWPKQIRNGGLTILGYMMGITFSAAVAVQIFQQLPSMAAATLLTVAFGLVCGWFTVKATGISMSSGLLGSIPGGLSQMTALCDEFPDSDMTVVTFMQTIRVMAVVFIVPFLAFHGLPTGVPGAIEAGEAAQATAAIVASVPWLSLNTVWYVLAVGIMLWLGPKLHLPTPYMLGPMLGAILLRSFGIGAPSLPHWSVVMAQIAVGAHMGVSTSFSSLSNWRKLLPYAVAGAVGIVLFSFLIGFGLTLWHPMSLATAFLGSAPGGMAEMGVTGASVGADLSILVAYQMFRLLFILFLSPYLLKGLIKLYRTRRQDGADFHAKGI